MSGIMLRSLFWKLFLPIGLLLILFGIVFAMLLPFLVRENAEQEAIAAGTNTVKQFKVLRKYYTDNVVSKLLAKGEIKPGADHKDNPDKVPLPASLVLDLSDLLKNEGTTIKLYSPYPFPNRKDRQMDAFGQDAWNYLISHPDDVFSRTEVVDGKPTVRVAMTDRMTAQACVACHNANPESPKRDWKLNDVRGVLEVDTDKQLASGQRITNQVLFGLTVLIIGIAVSLRIVYQRSVAQPLQKALDAAERVADGDLGHNIERGGDDEIGKLLTAISQMQNALVTTLREVRLGSVVIAEASRDIASGNMDLSSQTEHQTSNLEETASSMEELASTVKQNLEYVDDADRLVARAACVAERGGDAVLKIVETIASISESANKIADITGTIDSIAFQTNILALNAAVEAARAGEQGRGFAVVATEVRNLAQRAASAAREIKGITDESYEKVRIGSELAANAGDTMQELLQSVGQVKSIVSAISLANREQSTGIEQVNQAIIQIDDITQKNASMVEEVASAAESLQQQAAELAQLVQRFRFN